MNKRMKFRAWDGESMMDNLDCVTLGELSASVIDEGDGNLIDAIIMQSTGFKDIKGKEIFFGDIVNICHTVYGGAHLHDAVYTCRQDILGGIEFAFQRLLWESHGYNQLPCNYRLKARDGLHWVFDKDKSEKVLIVDRDQYTKTPHTRYPFNEDKESSFSSRYFEVMGNIYENPELLEDETC